MKPMANLIDFPPPAAQGCGYEDSHEGMQVYLVVPEPRTGLPADFYACFTQPLTVLCLPDVPLTHGELWRGGGAQREATLSRRMLASVLLGTRYPAAEYPDGTFWTAALEHLTPQGRGLFDTLALAYGTAPLLLTLLET